MNVGDLGKFIVAKGFKKLPKVQKISQSGHTGPWWPVNHRNTSMTGHWKHSKLKLSKE